MGGVSVEGAKGGRRSLDSEINMIPMIDLLMVTISFLLITAVWTHMARINADAQVPGPPRPDVEQEKVEPEKQLHVMMQGEGSARDGARGTFARSPCLAWGPLSTRARQPCGAPARSRGGGGPWVA